MTEKKYRPTKENLRKLQRDLRRKERQGDPMTIAALHRKIGHFHEALEQFEEAHAAYQKALAIHQTLDDEVEILADLANIANYYRHTGQLLEAATRLRTVIRRAEAIGHQMLIVASRLNLAYAYAQNGEGDKAIALLEQVIDEAKAADAKLTQRQALAFLGQIYSAREAFEPAIRAYQAAVLLQDVDATDESQLEFLSLMGATEVGLGKLESGIERLKRALDLAYQLEETRRILPLLSTLALAYDRAERYTDALPYYQQGLRWAKRTGNEEIGRKLLDFQARCQLETGALAQALRTANKALRQNQRASDTGGEFDNLTQIGTIHARAGKLGLARRAHQQALQIAQRQNDRRNQARCHYNLACCYALEGDAPNAASALRRSFAFDRARYQEFVQTDEDWEQVRESVEIRALIKHGRK